ncbi:MAG: zf-HC2 domain-containing protein [Candidatus Acidiferrales bacterium]|jgi:anti-sigma factor RsiW
MATDLGSGSTVCSKCEALLEDYLEGALTGEDGKRVAGHLEVCAGCREALADAEASLRLLRVAGPAEDPGPGFARAVMARIRAAEQEGVTEGAGFWQPFVSFGWKLAVTATLALGLLVTYDAGWAKRPQPNEVSARLTVRDIFVQDRVITPANGDEALMMVAETGHGNQ